MILNFILISSFLSLGLANEVRSVFKPHLAADEVMNIFYQNCQASKLPAFDFITTGETKGYRPQFNEETKGKVSILENLDLAQLNPYLNCEKKDQYICQHPPTYLWGGKGIIDEEKKIVDLFHNNSIVENKAFHPGLDCSGFINHVFLKTHLKVDKSFPYLKSADEISAKEFMKPLSCFKEVHIEKGQPIKPGDVITWNKHIVMVSALGPDPFGLKKIKNAEECDLRKLNPFLSSLLIINSKGANDPLGSMEMELSRYNQNIYNQLKLAATKTTGIGPGIIKMKMGQLTFTNPEDIMDLIQTACLAKFKIALPSRKIKVVRHLLSDQNYSENDFQECSIGQTERVRYLGDNLNCH